MQNERLFSSLTMVQVTQACEEAARRAVAAFTEPELLACGLEELTQAVLADKVPAPIVLDIQNHAVEHDIVPLPEQRGLTVSGLYIPSASRPAAEAVNASLYIPYTGTPQAFTYQPSRMPTPTPPQATVADGEVIVSVVADPGEVGMEVQRQLLEREQNLLAWADQVSEEIVVLEKHIGAMVRDLLARRLSVLRQRDILADGFTIPVRRVEPERALKIPVRPAAADLQPVAAATSGEAPEWSIADAVYERMITTITSFGHALERRPSSAALLLPDEETLRDWLMFLLSANYEAPGGGELFVGGEMVNGKGKTDILIRHQGRNAVHGHEKVPVCGQV